MVKIVVFKYLSNQLTNYGYVEYFSIKFIIRVKNNDSKGSLKFLFICLKKEKNNVSDFDWFCFQIDICYNDRKCVRFPSVHNILNIK